MNLPFEEALIEKTRRQVLIENATVVELDGKRFPVRRTRKRGLGAGGFHLRGERDSVG